MLVAIHVLQEASVSKENAASNALILRPNVVLRDENFVVTKNAVTMLASIHSQIHTIAVGVDKNAKAENDVKAENASFLVKKEQSNVALQRKKNAASFLVVTNNASIHKKTQTIAADVETNVLQDIAAMQEDASSVALYLLPNAARLAALSTAAKRIVSIFKMTLSTVEAVVTSARRIKPVKKERANTFAHLPKNSVGTFASISA